VILRAQNVQKREKHIISYEFFLKKNIGLVNYYIYLILLGDYKSIAKQSN